MLNHQEHLTSRIDLMIQSTHGRLRIQELEELLSYNGDYLSRLYRQQKGCSISEACRERMLRDARYLLRHSDKSVDEIMQELGVTSRGYFFAQFQKAFGMTPKEYRNLLLDDKKGLS